MGLIQRKEQDGDELLGDIEIIESGDTPGDETSQKVDLIGGASAEDIAAAGRHERGEDVPDKDEVPLTPFGDHEDDVADAAVAAAPAQGNATAQGGPDTSDAAPSDAAADKTHGVEQTPSKDDKDAGGNGGDHKSGHAPIFIAIAVVAVIAAAILGYFVGTGGFSSAKGLASSSLTDDQLDTVVASWTYNGENHEVTAREAIESQYSLDSVKNDDDTYPAPSADSILTYVRNQILLADAQSRGIEVTDDEMSDYAETNLGTSDYSTIATQYGVDEDQAKDIVRQNLMIQKLHDQVVPESTATMPDAPTQPSDDSDSNPSSKEYADYIINLAGDEWDSETGTWASTDGPYYQALQNESFTADSATYNQAMTAYYVAYQQYTKAATEASSTWTDYANTLFANSDLSLYGLYA
ncbi:hypothetical protein [Collinsella sp. An2]|uniref:hypothetical protein n=1 Tax=Collinsella sp. An2 TaxID=1965585 RepID=UPI000B3AA0F6|nr:hypothetical protein [Collinsella sp. An2]OUP09495.1 hypothetical protein B5F33_04850 [Collinsella sp. An2]